MGNAPGKRTTFAWWSAEEFDSLILHRTLIDNNAAGISDTEMKTVQLALTPLSGESEHNLQYRVA